MIYLRTGLPGSGKTLRTIWEGMQAADTGREVFALNVNGLDYDATGIKPAPFDDLAQWQDLPPGSVLIVDEVQKYLHPVAANTRQPDWIEAFTRNRHTGIDLHFVTQHPRLINYYVRELVNYHEHLIRLDGNMERTRVYYAEGLMDLGRRGPPRDAAFKLWRYPKDIYGVYKSAEVHTVERYIPQRLKIAAAAAVVLVLAVGVAVWAMSSITGTEPEPKPKAAEPEPQRVTAPAQSNGWDTFDVVGGRGQHRPGWSSAVEYAEAHTPMIDGLPWTAPVYADRQVTADPEIYCMIFHSEPERCICQSEQGTRMYVGDATCRSAARDGVYNPYRQNLRAAGAADGARSAGLFLGQQ